MKILFFCWEFPPVGSGIGVSIREMTRALVSDGHDVIVVASKDPQRKEEARPGNDKVTLYRLYDYGRIGRREIAGQVLEIAEKHRVDWIETADHLGEGAPLLLIGDHPPVVVKCHYNDVIPKIRYAQARWWWQRHLIDLACFRARKRIQRERESLTGADGLICITRRMLSEIESYGLDVPKKTAIIPNPIAEIPGWENDAAPDPTVLFVGRIDFGKGADFLPAILRRLTDHFPGVRLEIAGGDGYARGIGSIRKWLVARFGGLLESVRFLGHISPAALDQAYRRAWVVLVPSRWDTFPMAVLEAMVRSKSIVASPHGGMPEMLEGTGNRIADPATGEFAEAVLDLIVSDIRRLEAGREGYEKAKERYNPSRIARDYVETVEGWL